MNTQLETHRKQCGTLWLQLQWNIMVLKSRKLLDRFSISLSRIGKEKSVQSLSNDDFKITKTKQCILQW